jgi:hypothetical protein
MIKFGAIEFRHIQLPQVAYGRIDFFTQFMFT